MTTADLLARVEEVRRKQPPLTATRPRRLSGGEIRSELGRAGVPPKYAAAEWEQCRAAEPLSEYTGKIRHHRNRGEGLLLLGPVGTGKSSSAALVCGAAVHAGLSIRWFYVPDLVALLASKETLNHTLKLSMAADLLVWDDFGVEGLRDWQIGLLDRVVEARYRRDLPMVVTTNLSRKSLEDPSLARLNDRWSERRYVVTISGDSMRSTWRDRNPE